MGRLKKLVIADPSEDAARHIAEQTERLAERRFIATTGKDALGLVAEHQPEAVLISLEIKHPEAYAVVGAITKADPDRFVVATFRELSVPTMDRIGRLGVEDFIPQPIDFTQLFRAASQRFDTYFRLHTRYPVSLEVFRVDGVMVGKTLDVSEGGVRMACIHPVHPGHSLLVDMLLPEDQGKVRVRCTIIAVEGKAPNEIVARGQFHNLRGEDHKRLQEFLTALGR